MAFISKTVNGATIYSLYQYGAYTDNDFFKKLESLNSNSTTFNQNSFDSICENFFNLYKDTIIFLFEDINNFKYVSYVKSTDKMNNINKEFAILLSKRFKVEFVEATSGNNKADIRDAFTKEESQSNIVLLDDYKKDPILFLDVCCSTGAHINSIFNQHFSKQCCFLTIGIRFDSTDLKKSFVSETKELSEEVELVNYPEQKVVEIINLFGNKNITIDFRDNLSIVIGDNGDGKSTALRIATLAIDNNLISCLKLSNFNFERILIKRKIKKDNEFVEEVKEIKHKDLFPDRKKLRNFLVGEYNFDVTSPFRRKEVDYFSTFYKENENFLSLEKKIEPVIILLGNIDDDEFYNLYRLIIFGDFNYRFYIKKLIDKYNLKQLVDKQKDIINYLEYLHDFCCNQVNLNYIKDLHTYCYFDSTHSRNISSINVNKIFTYSNGQANTDLFDDEYWDDEYDEPDDDYEENPYDEQRIIESAYLDGVDPNQIEVQDLHGNSFYINPDDDYEFDGYNGWDVEPDDDEIYDMSRQDYEPVNLKLSPKEQREVDDERLIDDIRFLYSYLEKIYSKSLINRFIESDMNYYKKNLISSCSKFLINVSKDERLSAEPFSKDTIDLTEIIEKYYKKNKLNDYTKYHDAIKYAFSLRNSNTSDAYIRNNILNKAIDNPFNWIQFSNYEFENENVDEILENSFDSYILNNQHIITYGLLPILSIEEQNYMLSLINAKKMKLRKKFIKQFIEIIDSIKLDSCPKELIKLEKTINKYLVNKRISILKKTVFVIDNDNNYIPLKYLSSGERNLILVLFKCFYTNTSIMIFDEPEISMSIDWQKNLIIDMQRFFRGRTIIIASQSPHLVRNITLHKFVRNINDVKEV